MKKGLKNLFEDKNLISLIFKQLISVKDFAHLRQVNKLCSIVGDNMTKHNIEYCIHYVRLCYPFDWHDYKFFKPYSDSLQAWYKGSPDDDEWYLNLCIFKTWQSKRYETIIYPVYETQDRTSSVYLYYGYKKIKNKITHRIRKSSLCRGVWNKNNIWSGVYDEDIDAFSFSNLNPFNFRVDQIYSSVNPRSKLPIIENII